MSKIEDALNKAKVNKLKANSIIRTEHSEYTNAEYTNAEHKNSGQLTTIEQTEFDTVQYKASMSEITLMENGELLEAKQLSDMKIISSKMYDNSIANNYRDLRTKLIQRCQGKNFVVMLTSTADDYSSCTTAVNLATAFTFDESKTSLVIDSNINNPQLESCLNCNSGYGLTDYLENEEVNIESVIQKTGIPRLKAISAGKPREAAYEYYTSLRMRKLLSDLLKRYSDRYIFINSAPIADSADARILSDLCDFVILVVPYGKSSKNNINKAVDSIGKDKFAGVVFSEVPRLPSIKNTENR